MWSKMMSRRLNTTNWSLKLIILILQILLKKSKFEEDGTDFEDKINKIDKKYQILVVSLKKQILIPNLLK